MYSTINDSLRGRSVLKGAQFGVGFVAAYLLSTSACLAVDKETINGVTVYNQVPSAYEIAKTMFPPKTRTAIGHIDSDQSKKPGIVAFKIRFYYDSVEFLGDSQRYLDAMGTALNYAKLKDKSINIEGHADASGSAEYNMKLSKARADSIKSYLQVVHKIDPARLQTFGYGESRLLDNSQPYSSINRRVEFLPSNASQ